MHVQLTPVGVLTAVGHAEDASARVLQAGVDLVGKLAAVDGGAAAAGASGVAALDHKVGDDAVEGAAVVVAALHERLEVFAGARRVVGVQLDGDVAHGGLEDDAGGHGGSVAGVFGWSIEVVVE